MRNFIATFMFGVAVCLSSCEKHKESMPNTTLRFNTWIVGQDTFYADFISRNVDRRSYTAELRNNNGDFFRMYVVFKNPILSNGRFNVASTLVDSTSVVIWTQNIYNSSAKEYRTTGWDNKLVDVTFDNDSDKVQIIVPAVWAKQLSGDSVQISANITSF